MSKRVFITGFGIISAIGTNVQETLESLKSSRSGIGILKGLDSIHNSEIPAAEVKLSDDELSRLIIGDGESLDYSRTSLLGIIAAREAFQHAKLNVRTSDNYRTGIVSATTVGGMDKTEKHYYDFTEGKYTQYIHAHDCSNSTQRIADSIGITGYLSTISTACSSSVNSIIHAANLIKHNRLDRVVAGGTEGLSKFTLNGFNTLLLLDKELCKPFDKNRRGLNLGEGAAYLVLESEEAVGDQEIICELKGYANANDAYHQTASSPEGLGPYLSMKGALEMSGLHRDAISYINAHGTGTDNNDLTEGIAIQRLFNDKVPYVSSTKPFTGHTLGAAGAVEAVISILAIRNRLVFPNLNFAEKIEELTFEPVTELLTNTEINNVLSNSYGFGGNDSSLILSKV